MANEQFVTQGFKRAKECEEIAVDVEVGALILKPAGELGVVVDPHWKPSISTVLHICCQMHLRTIRT